jgi:hypothetical protein
VSIKETNDITHTLLKRMFDVMRTEVIGFSMMIGNFVVVPKGYFIL